MGKIRKAEYIGVECPACGSTNTYYIHKPDKSASCYECDENFFVDVDEYGEIFVDDLYEDDKPGVCNNCGGPYPLCADGCNLMD